MNMYLKLALVGLVPSTLASLFYGLEKHTGFGKWNYWAKQIIIGIFFGAAAVFGTEYGIDVGGAAVNARDAAPLCAGLIFGGPAGIIAGAIGGIERWFAVYWGVGSFTRVACSVSTALAGVYAALLRKFMFDNHKPSVFIGAAIGLVMETIHMMMVFLTNMNEPERAFEIIKICTAPMSVVNAFAVALALIAVSLYAAERKLFRMNNERITQKIQLRLFATILIAFIATTGFTIALQSSLSTRETNALLDTNIADVQQAVTGKSDENLLKISEGLAEKVHIKMTSKELQTFAKQNNIYEINIVNSRGIIIASTNPNYIDFDMHSGEQAAEFLCLLDGQRKSYVQPYQPITYDSDVFCKYIGVHIKAGFVQFGYDAERFYKDITSNVQNITVNRHIGEKGFMVVTNSAGVIYSDPDMNLTGKKVEEVTGLSMRDLLHLAEEGELFTITVNGTELIGKYDYEAGFYTFAFRNKAEADRAMEIAVYVNCFLMVLLFAVLYAVVYFIIKKLVVINIDKVNRSLTQITAGNLEEKVDVRDTKEFAELSDDINKTVDKLKEYIAQAAARIQAELELAKNIQASSLPNVFPPFPGRTEVDLFASMDPAKEVGGDFYDYYWVDDNKLALLVADVSGKGIPGAMFMMRAKTMIKNFVEGGIEPNLALTKANAGLCEGNDAEMFVTAWLGIVDVTTGHVEFANAGHNPPVIKQADGSFEYLRSKPGFVLAGMDGVKYKKQEFDIQPGSIIYLYTDGVTEATSLSNELYGEDRLINCLNTNAKCNMEQLCKAVTADINAFVGEADQFDDITMVAFKLVPEGKGMKELKVNATLENIPAVTAWVDDQLESMDCPMKAQMQIDIAIDELFSNIARYAYNPEIGPATVRVEVEDDPLSVIITFLDHGVPYDPLAKDDPDVTLSAEERDIGGLGIFMVKKTMDDIKYEYKDGQNILKIKKHL